MTYDPQTPAEELAVVIAGAIDDATGWGRTRTARDSAVVISGSLIVMEAAMENIDAAFDSWNAVTEGDADRHSGGDHNAAWTAADNARLAQAQAQLEADRWCTSESLAHTQQDLETRIATAKGCLARGHVDAEYVIRVLETPASTLPKRPCRFCHQPFKPRRHLAGWVCDVCLVVELEAIVRETRKARWTMARLRGEL
jgi:hypothetical protein